MQKCPKCQAELNNLNSSTCLYCGAELPRIEDNDVFHNESDSTSDSYIGNQNIVLPEDDELGIETPADLMETEAANRQQSNTDFSPIGESAPSLPSDDNNTKHIDNNSSINPSLDETGQVKKLTDEEVQEIEKNLYKSDTFISNKEKSKLIEKLSSIEEKPFGNTPIEPPKKDSSYIDTNENEEIIPSDLPRPKIAKKGQGIAYFYKHYIQLVGSQTLHPDDNFLINNREYILKPKQITNAFKFGAISAVFVLLMIISGAYLMGGNSLGEGQVIGLVLDEFDRPYIEGATVRIDELGKTTRTNSLGFFVLEDIPTGSHKIEYLINDQLVKEDFTTVVNSQQNLIVLRPSLEDIAVIPDPKKSTVSIASVPEPVKKPETTPKKPETTLKKTEPKKTKPQQAKATPKKKPQSNYGKITLAANIEGAKLKVDGNVLGAGNLTFSKIKTGNHKYTVSMDGYKTVTGNFSLKSGENRKINATLKPLAKEVKKETYKSDDFFYSANNALLQGDYQTAVDDFSSVLNKYPSNVDSYYGRGKAFVKLKKWDEAYSDYVRAAEIYQFKENFNDAISFYNKAIKIKDKDVTAFLGRGNLYLNKREYRAALTDFDKVVKIDKRNFAGYYGMGEASFRLQRYNKAIKYFKDARSIDDSNPLVYQYLTISYMFENDKKNIQKCYDKFMEIASETQINSFKKDSKYGAIEKIIKN